MKTLIAVLVSCLALAGCPKQEPPRVAETLPQSKVISTYNNGQCKITEIMFHGDRFLTDSCGAVKFDMPKHYEPCLPKGTDPIISLQILSFL